MPEIDQYAMEQALAAAFRMWNPRRVTEEDLLSRLYNVGFDFGLWHLQEDDMLPFPNNRFTEQYVAGAHQGRSVRRRGTCIYDGDAVTDAQLVYEDAIERCFRLHGQPMMLDLAHEFERIGRQHARLGFTPRIANTLSVFAMAYHNGFIDEGGSDTAMAG